MLAMRLKFPTFLSALALLLASAPAQADLAFVLTPATQSGVGSNEVVFTGTLTNTSQTDNLFLNNLQFSFTGAATNWLTGDTNFFFENVPGILLPGETYSDIVFAIALNPATPPGVYSGTATLQGGTNIFAATSLSGQPFQVSLPPATLALALSGTNRILSWGAPPAGFALQQVSDLTTANWVTVTNTPNATNGRNHVVLSPTNGIEFYRLKYP